MVSAFELAEYTVRYVRAIEATWAASIQEWPEAMRQLYIARDRMESLCRAYESQRGRAIPHHPLRHDGVSQWSARDA